MLVSNTTSTTEGSDKDLRMILLNDWIYVLKLLSLYLFEIWKEK